MKKTFLQQTHKLSQDYYRIEGIDRLGRIVSRNGIDPDKLLEECKEDIVRLFQGSY